MTIQKVSQILERMIPLRLSMVPFGLKKIFHGSFSCLNIINFLAVYVQSIVEIGKDKALPLSFLSLCTIE